jgi:streptogramin lyase
MTWITQATRARALTVRRSASVALGSALAILASPLCAGSAAASATGAITEFSAGLSGAPASIVSGSDGSLWFSQEGAARGVGSITPSGAITELAAGLSAGSRPRAIAMGPEGNLWFTDEGTTPAIGRITPSGVVTEFSAGLNPGSKPLKIASGPDGNIWFTDQGTTKAIGRVTPAGAITEFSGGLNEGSEPIGIAPGADGNVWFTDEGTTPAIGWIAPSGAITEMAAGLGRLSKPRNIVPGPDGNMWFTDEGAAPAIGRITPSGAITEFAEGGVGKGEIPRGIAPGPDGNLWFTAIGATSAIGRITPSGAISEFSVGTNAEDEPVNIAPGPDGNMWFVVEGPTPAIGQIGTGAAAGLAAPPAVTGNDQAGAAQICGGTAWATWAYVLQPSASLLGFDGYRWLLDGSEAAAGQSYTPLSANIGHQLACAVTVTYPLLDVTIPAASPPVTVIPPPPAITGVHQSAPIWREGSRLAQIGRRKGRKRALPVGTTFSFVANEQASVSLSFTRLLAGRAVARRCVTKTRRNAAHRGCLRQLAAGALSLAGHSGRNSVFFEGRIGGRVRLAPGRYTLTIMAANSVGARSVPASLDFEVLR